MGYKYSRFMVLSSEGGGSQPIYGGLCMIGGYGEGYFFSTWVAVCNFAFFKIVILGYWLCES
jgi:hypothetical protein